MADTVDTDQLVRRKKRTFANLAGFILGIPAGLGILAAFHYTTLSESEAARYVRDPVEWAEVEPLDPTVLPEVLHRLGNGFAGAQRRHQCAPAVDHELVHHRGARRIEPLDVVDDEQRITAG